MLPKRYYLSLLFLLFKREKSNMYISWRILNCVFWNIVLDDSLAIFSVLRRTVKTGQQLVWNPFSLLFFWGFSDHTEFIYPEFNMSFSSLFAGMFCTKRKKKTKKPLWKPVPVYFISLLLYSIFLRRWRCWGTHNYLWNKLFEGVIDTLAWLYVSLLTMLLKGFSSARLHSNSRQVAKAAYQWVTE